MMKRRTLLLAMLSAGFAPMAEAQAKPVSLKELSAYLNSLSNAQGSFTQINSDGSRSKGTFFLKRPGRMRFEYQGRDAPLVVAGQGKLAIFDKKSNAGPQQYPLRRTPLQIILKEKVNLNRSGMVTRHKREGQATSIVARDPEHPNLGHVKLVFSEGPVELREWVVTDESGRRTVVKLGKLDKVKRIPARLFDVKKLIKENGVIR
ncbi:MAG: outer membrane lipoprotein carrier protein LolA [Rhodobacteraceae bacterium]|nr:outer membrane lipoprotein carrier protein LolA [Paracoccaceae bacterium]